MSAPDPETEPAPSGSPDDREAQDLFGARLRAALDKTDVTAAELARRLKVTPAAVSHWLRGARTPPADVVARIARVLRVERAWLEGRPADGGPAASSAGGDAPASGGLPGFRPGAASPEAAALAWGFRVAPRDGRDFGNAGIYATPQSVRSMIRESLQNSSDARRAPADEVVVRVRVIELPPGSERRRTFLRALGYEEGLEPHLRAAVDETEFDSKLAAKLRGGLRAMERTLVLVAIDDYNTRGLQGGETDSKSAFAALCRDNLNSQKAAKATAGGAFGLGSKTFWACSQISTVLFASKVAGERSDEVRVIGKTDLGWHAVPAEDGPAEEFAGPGWLGRQTGAGVHSVRVPDGDPLLDALFLRRDPPPGDPAPEPTGTTVLVVAFHDPKEEAATNTARLAEQVAEAAATSFWPAMLSNQLAVSVERYVGDEQAPVSRVRVDPRTYVPALCEAYERYVAGDVRERLAEAGDVMVLPIPVTVPATKDAGQRLTPHPELEAECRLVVRLSDPDELGRDPRLNHVGFTRGRGMITRYAPKSNVVVGARPFHAVLLAGTFVGQGLPEVAVEQFLRMAEPPAHDTWEFTDDLRVYARGAGTRIKELYDRVTAALQQVLLPAPSEEQRGPEALRRLLQLRSASKPREQAPARLRRAEARLGPDGAWRVRAEVVIDPTSKPLHITPRLAFDVEGGSRVPLRWLSLESADPRVQADGSTFVVAPRTRAFSFEGASDPESHVADASECGAVLDLLTRTGS